MFCVHSAFFHFHSDALWDQVCESGSSDGKNDISAVCWSISTICGPSHVCLVLHTHLEKSLTASLSWLFWFKGKGNTDSVPFRWINISPNEVASLKFLTWWCIQMGQWDKFHQALSHLIAASCGLDLVTPIVHALHKYIPPGEETIFNVWIHFQWFHLSKDLPEENNLEFIYKCHCCHTPWADCFQSSLGCV